MNRTASEMMKERLAKAVQVHQAGKFAEAERLYLEILRDDAGHADTLHYFGVLAHQTARNELAVELIGKAIARNGHVPAYYNNLGNALKALGKWHEAAAAYRSALHRQADYVPAYYNLAVVLQAEEVFDEAAVLYVRVIACQPNHVEAHLNLGNVLQALGRLDESVASYRRALNYRPGFADAHVNLGNVLKAQGKFEDALACYRQALHLKPDMAQAYNNLGILQLERGASEDAVAACTQAVTLAPDFAEAHCNLGTALRELGRPAAARASFQRALALKPDYAEARMGMANAVIPIFPVDIEDSMTACANFALSLDELRAWNTQYPGKLHSSAGSQQPFYLAYRPGNLKGVLSRYGDLVGNEAAAHDSRHRGKIPPTVPQDRIRLALVSGHVRRHPVWDMILRGLLAHIDRGRFDLSLYHTGSIRDEETSWARARVDRFIQGPRRLAAWRKEITEGHPDIILYPEVGMDRASCALAAMRLAPLQAAAWGHPVTTGLPTVDLFLSGELLEAADADAHYRERLVRLPGTGVCVEATQVLPLPWGGPPRSAGVIRFALCQQPIKFDPADDAVLTRIAQAVGPSEFWLVSPRQHSWATAKLRERLALAFRAAGLDPDAHLRVTPWLPPREFAGYLDSMDIYLDCPSFSGFTTAWAATQRGLPIATVEGAYLRQRLAAGLLRQIGVTEGIAATREQYVDLVIRWASEWRHADAWAERRSVIARASASAAGNPAAVRVLEKTLADAVQASATVTSVPPR
jgi:protein O-GlcNAc transferase